MEWGKNYKQVPRLRRRPTDADVAVEWQRHGAAAYRIQDIRPYRIRSIKFSVLKFRVSPFANVNKRVPTIAINEYVFVSVSVSES